MSRVTELLQELQALHDAKNHDYAHSADVFANFREAERLGISPFVGCLVRMSDKWARICNLARYGDPAVRSETIVDTLRDLAVYCLIAIALYEERGGTNGQTDPANIGGERPTCG